MNVYINCISGDEDRPYQGGLVAVAANSVQECIDTMRKDKEYGGCYTDKYFDYEVDCTLKHCDWYSELFKNDNWKLQPNLVANVDTPQVLFGDYFIE